MRLEGRIWVFEERDNMNTDILYPGEFLQQKLTDEEMAKVTFHNYDPRLTEAIEKGELENAILLWGKDGGAGSSRIQAAKGLKFNNVGAVVAESYAGIYYRSGINIGFPLIICPQLITDVYGGLAQDFFQDGKAKPLGDKHYLEIDMTQGQIVYHHPSGTQEYQFPKLPPELLTIFDAGGLIPSIRKAVERGEYADQR